ncbi:uncharacterized protein LOC120271632 [Dioscorea cayenensis subsp. rotundata]|uniref:Uncharacterized protein LOC120271632 n=1 Tax=Dioscorea cayennensis subsp. rotundata TaxID=55577 RepID=A0AB40C5L6_DIOCR|nr:uncharacterized protein LOC120271632 [Dioscorea cayenensis subsp. rotundata]
MPKYAKFMKDLLINKRKLEELETVVLPQNCSAMIQRKLPKKLTNLGSFSIACMIGEGMQEKALADSGASINVMPYKLFLKLGLEDMIPTRMTIQLADRSIQAVYGPYGHLWLVSGTCICHGGRKRPSHEDHSPVA